MASGTSERLIRRVLLEAQLPAPITPADLITQQAGDGVAAFDAILGELLDGIEGIGTPEGALLYLNDKPARLDVGRFAVSMFRLGLQGSMLGATDAEEEVETELPKRVERFSSRFALRRGDFRPQPFEDAIRLFVQRRVVTKEVWEAMIARARTESFTIARLSTIHAIEVMRDEITRSLTDADFGRGRPKTDLRAFRRRIEARLRAAGLLSAADKSEIAALAPSHVETVFRNGVMGAYSDGRRYQMSQPHVVAARPYWQVMTVNDGPPRQRRTHQNVHGWVMLASDAGWNATFPPFGHNCRCRVVARSASWVESNSPTVWSGALPDLPDRGWVTRSPPILVAA